MASYKNIFSSKWFPLLILGICSICLFIRSFYTFNWSDESHYLTVVHRFWLGERIIADEWYHTQINAPLSLPFYAFYQWISGSNEGVYFYFRLLYWAISTFTAFFTYLKLQKQNSYLASLICALIYFLYSRANIGGMSYYNMTLTYVLLATLLLYDQFITQKWNRVILCITGVFLALAVANTPFFAFPYITIIIFLLLSKKYRSFWHEIVFVIIGTSITAIIYLGYVLYNTPINELVLNIPYILNEPARQKTNPIWVIPVIAIRIIWRYKWTIWGSAFLIMYIRYKKRSIFSETEISRLIGINLLIFMFNSFLSGNLLGCINIAGTLFAVPMIYIFRNWEDIDKKIAGTFGIAGGSLILSFSFSSNTGLDAMTIGFVLIGISMVLLTFQLDELKQIRLLYSATLTVFFVMLFQTAILRLFSVFRDAPISQIDTQITSGPAKYLYTTEEHAAQYDELNAAIDQYVREDDLVFYSQECFWAYLCTNNEYGVPSSWRMPFDSPRLEVYYKLNPEKLPSCIFVLNPAYGNYESSMIQGNEKADFPNKNNVAGYLYNYIQENNYEVIQLECATIYRSPESSNRG